MRELNITESDLTGRVWHGLADRCDLCQCELGIGPKIFVDGRMKDAGAHWAMMCLACHQSQGIGLGTGKGQAYALRESVWCKLTDAAYTRLVVEYARNVLEEVAMNDINGDPTDPAQHAS